MIDVDMNTLVLLPISELASLLHLTVLDRKV
jgi:hypothetical protein